MSARLFACPIVALALIASVPRSNAQPPSSRNPRDLPQGTPAATETAPTDEDPPPLQPAPGPTEPGPWATEPGYYTSKAVELNYDRTPFFNGRGCWTYGPADAGGGQPYFPGVYPYYDAQAHYRWYMAHKRERMALSASDQFRVEGLDAFKAGDYETAAVRLLGAADLDHGDAASRIHAGHALFALGRYEAAVELVRRGLELQPLLAYGGFNPRHDYGKPQDFDEHLAILKRHIDSAPADAAAITMLAYVTYFTEGTSRAAPLLARAATLAPKDSLVRRLHDVSRKASWNERLHPAAADRRTYDEMGVRARGLEPYDSLRRKPRAAPADSDDRGIVRSGFRRI